MMVKAQTSSQARACAKGRLIAKRFVWGETFCLRQNMQTKGESLELPVYTELRPPGGETTNSVYTKTFRIKQAFICSLSKMQL